ncbi:hypothetical protein [Brevibacillus daliensis]|nr:hypothetical protein [Brevibacillus daliensis]
MKIKKILLSAFAVVSLLSVSQSAFAMQEAEAYIPREFHDPLSDC